MYGIKSNPASLLILIKCLVVKTTKTIKIKILIYASNGLCTKKNRKDQRKLKNNWDKNKTIDFLATGFWIKIK
jgi:hypothetical protein